MAEETLAGRILKAVDAVGAGIDDATERDRRCCDAINLELRKELGVYELQAALAEITRNLDSASPFQRADMRAAAAKVLRALTKIGV